MARWISRGRRSARRNTRHPLVRWTVAAGVAALAARRARPGLPLRGKVALITGGSRGLGLLLARELATRGVDLVICARDDRELRAARRDLEAHGARVLAIPCDVADEGQVRAMVAEAIDRFARIDIVINNASIIQVGPLDAMSTTDFHEAMAINFGGVLNTCLAVLPHMRGRGDGRIVNITSIGGKVAVPHLLPYDCAKFATVGLSEGLRAELARDNIKVTTVVPGLMRTGSPVNAFFKGRTENEFAWFALASSTPLTTVSARRAARRIIGALRRGEAFVTISWQAKALRLAHDLFPAATARALGVVNRVLPGRTGGPTPNVRGMRLAHRLAPSRLTALMNRAARRNLEFAGEPEPSRSHAKQVGLRK